jgi:hypothetical protein
MPPEKRMMESTSATGLPTRDCCAAASPCCPDLPFRRSCSTLTIPLSFHCCRIRPGAGNLHPHPKFFSSPSLAPPPRRAPRPGEPESDRSHACQGVGSIEIIFRKSLCPGISMYRSCVYPFFFAIRSCVYPFIITLTNAR